MQAELRAQAVDPHRAGNRVQGEGLEKAQDPVQAEDLEQEEDQNPHYVLFLAHNQDQLRDLE